PHLPEGLVRGSRRQAGDLQLALQVAGRRLAANHAVGLVGDGRLVDDRVVSRRLDALSLAPGLREDVVDVQGDLFDVQLLDASLPEEVAGAFPLHQYAQSLVGRTLAGA